MILINSVPFQKSMKLEVLKDDIIESNTTSNNTFFIDVSKSNKGLEYKDIIKNEIKKINKERMNLLND